MMLVILMLAALLPASAIHADAIIIEQCSEAELDRALAQAQDGDTITFACSGIISITSTKIISHDLILSGGDEMVVLDGGRSVRVFYIVPTATVTLSSLTIQHASAESGGSAINNTGTLTLSNSTLIDNVHAVGNFGMLTVTNTTIANNNGVGIFNSGDLIVTGSTIAGNRHGIDNASGTLTVINSTFYGNRVYNRNGIGAGIANSGIVSVINSTFVGNTAPAGGSAIGTHRGGTVTLINTLLVGSEESSACFGTMIDWGHNLQYPANSCGAGILSADPLLVEQPEGEFSVYTLLDNSPAHAAGDSGVCAQDMVGNIDQYGTIRITADDPTCDIGAVEGE